MTGMSAAPWIMCWACAAGTELGKDWALAQPEGLQGKQLAAAERAYSAAAALGDFRRAHGTLSGKLTFLALRMGEHSQHRSNAPLKVGACLPSSRHVLLGNREASSDPQVYWHWQLMGKSRPSSTACSACTLFGVFATLISSCDNRHT